MSPLLPDNRRQIVSHLKRRVARHGFEPQTLSELSAKLAEPILPLTSTEPPGPTVVLLNDCHDQDNFGAHALIDGLIRILTSSLPTSVFRPIPSHWLLDTSHGFGAFTDRGSGMRQLPARYPAVADQFEAVADEWLRGKGGPGADELLRRLEGADLVFLNGEGSIYRTNLSAIRELFLAWLCKSCLGIPTVFVNATVHLTDVVPILPAMLRKSLSMLDVVAVREPFSLRNMAQYAPDLDVRLIPDSAFAVTPDDARATHLSDLIRTRLGDSPYFCFDPGPMPIDHRPGPNSALFRLITNLKQLGPEAVFVRSDPADTYIQRVAEETNSLYIDATVDYREWMTVVKDAQFLVTGRYHNPILAAIMGCPTIALGSSSHKVHGGCEMLEVIGSPYDGTYLGPQIEAIADHARGYIANRSAIADRLRSVCQTRRSETVELGALTTAVLRGQTESTGRKASLPAS